MSDEQQLLTVLRRHGVPFVVIGGYAVNFHGYVRTTEDVDVVWLRSPQAEQDLHAALTELNAAFIGDEIDPGTGLERTIPVTLQFIQSTRLMMLVTRLGFLDLFDYVPGIPQENPQSLFDSAVAMGDLAFVSLDWLRRMKHASARPKDLDDLQNLSE
jgi:hypothetical protein